MIMKTTDINVLKDDLSKNKKSMKSTDSKLSALTSLRPQKSMMRVKSLRPKRLVAQTRKVNIRPTQTK